MYNVLDICRYVVNISDTELNGISNLKLQKILYFIQAYFLISTGKPCFSENIEAWDFGPVVPVAYHNFKQFGAMNIPSISTYLEYDSNNMWNVKRKVFNENIILEEDRNKIRNVLNIFKDYSATSLVDLTHNQAPWKNAYVPGMNNIITLDSIRRYFND